MNRAMSKRWRSENYEERAGATLVALSFSEIEILG
jgi:hypothetical protein